MDKYDFGLLSDDDDIRYEFTTTQAEVNKAFHADLLRIREGKGEQAREYLVDYVAFRSDGEITFQKGKLDD